MNLLKIKELQNEIHNSCRWQWFGLTLITEVIKKLNKFKNIYRKFAYSKGDFTFKQKINFYLYYIKANLKNLIKYLIAR